MDELEVIELTENMKGLERIGTSFNYYIRGILNENFINAGINIFDEEGYFKDFMYLLGKPVEIRVDRIDVEFLN